MPVNWWVWGIPGPPGTGKTYIGLKIVQALLLNLYKTETDLGGKWYTYQPVVYLENNKQVIVSTCYFTDDRYLKRMAKKEGTMAIMQRPILIVCFTNHALDQFLEGMLDFCDESG